MKIFNSDNAPKAIGPYVQAIESNNTIYFSGMLGINPSTGKFDADDAEIQTQQIIKNIVALLNTAELTSKNIIKTTIFLADMNDFQKINEIYGKFFHEHKPARSCVEVAKLPLGAKIEIEVIAIRN